ncbi:penicillin-binding protein [Terribacillus saccharophilus]|uniref:serine-type D-Ala-D-Ala carboxypeptidase n=2 Tax=Terribacillus saccharophilus TaxID=361277 RepID=A0ABX4GW42_9BACI|nr:penicillin-binding protein [Terribacillus saccharophilus]PAD95517.1 penicillin-binding protein [Terribacillus saccharophilus]PAD99095.1 penicillin-binding protein [Terribacillus saccharophilus]
MEKLEAKNIMTKKRRKKRALLPFRLNILFAIVFLLFSALILQLGVVQIINGEEHQAVLEQTTNDIAEISVPRGMIYDSGGNVIVGNEPVYSITYTPPKNGDPADKRLDIATKLADIIKMEDKSTEKITEREYKEYWFLLNSEEANKRITASEKESLDDTEVYDTTLKRITEDDYKELENDEKAKQIIAIKRELDSATELVPHVIKNKDVTEKEYATIAENMGEMSGINVTTDWTRNYPYDGSLQGILGSIKTGIPEGEEDYYKSHNYQLNDRIGTSGLEKEYESLLKGDKKRVRYVTDNNNNIVSQEVISDGQRGQDLQLSINMDFQKELDKIVRDELKSAINRHPGANRYLEDAMAVMLNPNTGEIYAASGQHYNRENNEYESADMNTVFSANAVGSTVKGATLLAGYQEGAVTMGAQFLDTPMIIKDTPEKSSYKNMGWINDLQALQMSSNVYMFNVALHIGGEYNQKNGESVSFDQDAFRILRNYYNQVGLGVETGVDLPSESVGYVGTTGQAGNLLDFSIGQFDTYTTMQLAQYVSTIANGGYRIKPHFVSEIHEPSNEKDKLGPLAETKSPEILNKITATDEQIERVKTGFEMVFQTTNGTASRHLTDKAKSYNIAGKTGTAQTSKNGTDLENWTLIGYADADNPEIAFAIMVPNLGIISSGQQYPITYNIANSALEYYYEHTAPEEEEK